MVARLGADTIGGLRREKAHGAVTPVVRQRTAIDDAQDIGLIEVEDRQQLDGGHAEVFQVGDLLRDSGERAGVLDGGGRRLRESSDVHLIDNRVLGGKVERPVALPVVDGGVDDHRAHGSSHVVIRPAGADAVPEAVGVAARIGVDEDLIPVEPVAGAGVERATHAVSVVGARLKPAHEDMPEVKGLVDVRVQRDRLKRLRGVMGGEEEQFDTGGILRKEREIDAVRRWGGAEGVR